MFFRVEAEGFRKANNIMQTWGKRILTIVGIGALSATLHAQSLDQTNTPDSIVQITAEAYGLTPVAPEELPPIGTYWEALPGNILAPLPCPPADLSLPIYEMADGIFLCDATGGAVSLPRNQAMTSQNVAAAVDAQGNAIADLIEQVQETEFEQSLAMSFGIEMTTSGEDAGGTFSPSGLLSIADFGTNLWIAQVTLTNGYFSAIASNTLADVLYEVQTNGDLAGTNWNTFGVFPFFYGASLTNWTALDAIQINQTVTNVFFRLKSWQDDGSGLPIWWQQQYGVSDPYGDPDGDGWSNLQEFQNGTNPNSFDTPPAPTGLAFNYNSDGSQGIVSWNPSPGAVTGYTVSVLQSWGVVTNFSVPASQTSKTMDVLAAQLISDYGAYPGFFGNNLYQTYQVKAQYGAASSAPATINPFVPGTGGPSSPIAYYPASVISDQQGNPYLAIPILPPGTVKLRLVREDIQFENDHDMLGLPGGIFDQNVTNDIPATNLVNGMAPLAAAWFTPETDPYGYSQYEWWLQFADTNGSATAVAVDFGQVQEMDGWNSWLVPPFHDGRTQLKQDLVFKFRAALSDRPFAYNVFYTNDYNGWYAISGSTNYTFAGFYSLDQFNLDGWPVASYRANVDSFLPFKENYFYRNFVFDATNLDANGRSTTGVGGDLQASPSGLTIETPWGYGDQPMQLPLAWQYPINPPPANGAAIDALLPADQTRWLASYPFDTDYSPFYLNKIGVIDVYYNGSGGYEIDGVTRNCFGLPFVSAKVSYSSDATYPAPATDTFDTSHYSTNFGYFYPETAQPQFQLAEYDFWNPNEQYQDVNGDWHQSQLLPGQDGFTSTSQSQPFFLTTPGSSIQIAGYAKLSLQNGYSGKYGYLGQYFDQAYKVTNGIVTTNTMGVLSAYGKFFATEPGQVALVTMPDLDTGERGTCMVYSVSAVIDRTQASNMDLSFAGANATSLANPAVIWCNNNYDRGHTVDGNDFEQDDLGPVDILKFHLISDCQYTNNGLPAIPCTRDLEDYFRFWLPGVAAAMKAMPANYTVRLTLSGDAQIRIFHAYESDGGTNYLFDETTASNQVANSASLYVGLLTSSSPITFNLTTNFNEHFILCGATSGSAQIDLQILDGNGNTVADTPAYLQINDIKHMYERWTVGENATNAPLNVATWQVDNQAFRYSTNTDNTMPYILFVHGWNMETWEKDRYAEAAYKRLYWQGYKGRFGFYRWPTGNKFSGIISALTDARNYDNSESNAWASAVGLTNLLTQLNAEYPGEVYLMAHSMGNVVAGEALRKASSQWVNTYIAMQGAVPAHCYDASTANRNTYSTPDRYANYYTSGASSYFSSSTGAGTYVNFYNTNDYALGWWNVDQNQKPDNGLGGVGINYPGYFYSTSSGFYKIAGSQYNLSFPANTYEIFAYADPSWSYALGAQASVGGVFKKGSLYQEVDLPSVWPVDTHPHSTNSPYSEHVWHSAQFRSDNMSRAVFWNTLMKRMFP